MLATAALSSSVGTGLACGAFGVPLASYHRRRKPKLLPTQPLKARRVPRRLVAEERGVVLATLNVVGGFVVTDRMLEMFKGRQPPSKQPTK